MFKNLLLDEEGRVKYLHLLALLVVLVLLITFAYYYVVRWIIGITFDNFNEFGNVFGGLNAIFSGLAFLALIVTLILQRREYLDNQAKLEQQIKQITFSSELKTLMEFLNMNKERKDANAIFIANTLLNNFAMKVISDKKFAHLVRPTPLYFWKLFAIRGEFRN